MISLAENHQPRALLQNKRRSRLCVKQPNVSGQKTQKQASGLVPEVFDCNDSEMFLIVGKWQEEVTIVFSFFGTDVLAYYLPICRI